MYIVAYDNYLNEQIIFDFQSAATKPLFGPVFKVIK